MLTRPIHLLALAVLLTPFSSIAQSSVPKAVIVPDGGVGDHTMESIFIPPIKDAPFSLMLRAEWARPLSGGGTITLANRRPIARDSKGRIYQERWSLVPRGGKIQSEKNVIQISDPTRHIGYNCFVARKVCEMIPYSRTTDENYKPAVRPTGPMANGNGSYKEEDLGTATIDGVDTVGYRETTTLNEGVEGNDQPIVSVREFNYSPRLKINLVSKVDNPLNGKQTFSAEDVSTAEPDPALFNLPEGYTVVDHRQEQ